MLLHLWHSIRATPRLREHFRPLWGLVSGKEGHCCCDSSRAWWAPSTPRGTRNKYNLWPERGRAEAMHTRLLEAEDKARASLCGVCFTYESGLCEWEENLTFLLLLFRSREEEWAAVRWCQVKKQIWIGQDWILLVVLTGQGWPAHIPCLSVSHKSVELFNLRLKCLKSVLIRVQHRIP